MNLFEFIATARFIADLRTVPALSWLHDNAEPVPGYVFLDGDLCVEGPQEGPWSCTVGNDSRTVATLAEGAAMLYAFAVGEGFTVEDQHPEACDDETAEQYLRALFTEPALRALGAVHIEPQDPRGVYDAGAVAIYRGEDFDGWAGGSVHFDSEHEGAPGVMLFASMDAEETINGGNVWALDQWKRGDTLAVHAAAILSDVKGRR